MGIVDKMLFAWDCITFVNELLEKWCPVDCYREKDFEISLYNYLHLRLPDIQVTKQFGVGRTRADIVIGKKVALELKHDLDTTAKYQRLVGQLMDYDDWSGHVVVVLTGANDPELVKRLRDFVITQSSRWTLMEVPRFALVVKESAERPVVTG